MGIGLTQYIPLVLYCTGIVVVFLTIFYKTEIGIFFLVPLAPLQAVRFKIYAFPLGKDLLDILMIALLVGWFLRKQDKILEKNPLNLPVFLLILVTLGALVIGSEGNPFSLANDSFIRWKNFVYMPVLFLITVNNIKDEKHIKILMLLMTLSIVANDFYFQSTFKWIKTYHFSNRERLSTFADLGPNEMASFFAQCNMVLFGLWLTYRHKWMRVLLGVIFFANTYPIIYSYSRGGYLAVFLPCIFLGIVKDRRILVILLLLGVFWRALLPVSVVDRISMTQNEEGEFEHSSQLRLELWKAGLRTFTKNPLGVGFNRFQSLRLADGKQWDAHNAYIKILVEWGIQGFLIYIALYLSAIRIGWRLYRNGHNEFVSGLGLGFVASTLANIVSNFFGQSWMFFAVTSYYWVFLALVTRADITVRVRAENNTLKPTSA